MIVISVLVAVIIIVLIRKIMIKERFMTYAGKEYEKIAREIYNSLLNRNPELTIEEARPTIYSIIDEKWFVRLNREQISDVTNKIREYLSQNNAYINETDLRHLVSNLKNRFGI